MSRVEADCPDCRRPYLWDEEATGCRLCGWGGAHDGEQRCLPCVDRHEDRMWCGVFDDEESGHYFVVLVGKLFDGADPEVALRAVRCEWLSRKV